jgi:hypothetical protein
MGRVGVAVALGILFLAAPASEAVEAQASCPSFDILRAKLNRQIAALKPGMPLQEFTHGFASQALNFETPTSREGALFFVGVSEGNATVTDELQCRFDSAKKLISCHRECCAYNSREISPAQFESLVIGESRQAIELRLCSPSTHEGQKGGRVATYYHIDLPIGHHDEGQTVMLVYERGKLISKGMSPYY